MSVAKKIAFNTFISVSARMLGMLLALLSIGFLTRYLGPEGFGEYSTILAFLFIFSIAADFGLQTVMVREISKPEADEKKIVGNIFGLRMAIAAAIFSAASVLVYFFPYSQNVKQGVLMVCVANFFGSLIQLLSGVFQKYLDTAKLALAEISARLLQTALIIIFIRADLGFFPLVAAIAASNIFNFLLIHRFARRYVPFEILADLDFWKKTLAISLPIGISSMLTLVYFKFNAIILSLIKGQAEVGLFSAAYKVLEVSIFIPAVFAGLVMPFFSKYAFSDNARFLRYFQRAFDITSLVALPMTIGGILFSEEIMRLIGGEKFAPAAPSLVVIMIATGFIFYGNLFGNALISLNRQKTLMFIYAAGAVLSLPLNLFFIKNYSYFGAALVTAAVEFLVVGGMAVIFYKTTNVLPDFKIPLKALFASLAMAGAIVFSKKFGFVPSFFIASAVYLASVYLIGGITREEINLIFKKEL